MVTGALVGLQSFCVVAFAVSCAMVHFARRRAWVWPMGLTILGLALSAALAGWDPSLPG